jgi:N-formylglutamate amidohydrolase
VDLRAPDPCPFRLVRPLGRETPVVVEVPHAGLGVDAAALSTMVVPARCLARDADLFVDEVVQDVVHEGATLLVAGVSRFVVDLNRDETDHDPGAVEGSVGDSAPHGVVWHRATLGERVLSAPLSRGELARRLDVFHRPYHRELAALIAEKKQRFGHAIVLSAHSMPSNGVDARGRTVPRADVVPGTRGRTSAAGALIDHVDGEARARGLSVRHDDPYRGGFVTRHYGKPSRNVHVVQIELARRLYMSEDALCTIEAGMTRLRGFYRDLARTLATVPLAPRAAAARS